MKKGYKLPNITKKIIKEIIEFEEAYKELLKRKNKKLEEIILKNYDF